MLKQTCDKRQAISLPIKANICVKHKNNSDYNEKTIRMNKQVKLCLLDKI